MLTTILTQLAAWMYHQNLLYMVAGAEVSLLLLSYVLVGWTFRRVLLSRQAPPAAHRGEPFPVTVRIENRKSKMPAFFVSQRGCAAKNGHGTYIPKISPAHAAHLRTSHVFEKRGVCRLPAIEVATAFPFGLIEARRRLDDDAEIVVYPRVFAVRPEAINRFQGAGNPPRAHRGHGDEYFSLRDYAPGDDMRRVAWRASARRGSLLVREMAIDTSRFVTIALDTCWREDVPEFEERFEEAVELAASLAVAFLNSHYKVAIITPSALLPIDEGQRHSLKVLDMLARIQPVQSSGWERLSSQAQCLQTDQTTCLCVSPDPRTWGNRCAFRGARVVNPNELILA